MKKLILFLIFCFFFCTVQASDFEPARKAFRESLFQTACLFEQSTELENNFERVKDMGFPEEVARHLAFTRK